MPKMREIGEKLPESIDNISSPSLIEPAKPLGFWENLEQNWRSWLPAAVAAIVILLCVAIWQLSDSKTAVNTEGVKKTKPLPQHVNTSPIGNKGVTAEANVPNIPTQIPQNQQDTNDYISADVFSKKQKDERVNHCLERVGLAGINVKYPSETSGGMQKRVGIARAIVLNPKYLFCDEPNSGLDPKTSIIIDELIHSITIENNITTVINTHDMNSVMEIGDTICFIHEGCLEWRGNKNEVLESPNQELQSFMFASPFLQRLRERALSK